MKNFIKGFRFTPSNYPAAVEDKIQKYRKQGYKLPPRKVLRTPEQLEGIRESAKINTALLDHIAENIREGMSTEEIDRFHNRSRSRSCSPQLRRIPQECLYKH